ncbi:CHAT domain-containing protein, partial [Fulvivirga sp. RKSG066]|uniref:CHAT domain-containing protein n=1 Tax=Fulvivirga aurantia TaxID=2529383 RepID=UPI0012BCE91C
LEDFNQKSFLLDKGIATNWQYEADSMKTLMSDLSGRINTLAEDEPADSLFTKLKLAEDYYDSLHTQITTHFPEYYQLASSSFKSLKEVQAAISTDQSILSYFLVENKVYLLASNSQESKLVKIELAENFGGEVVGLIKKIKDPGSSPKSFKRELEALYKLLVSPANSIMGETERLLILPDSYLSYLPFDLLLTEEITSSSISDWPFMIKKWAIGHDFSMSMHLQTSKLSHNNNLEYMGFAPTYTQDSIKELMVYEQDSNFLLANRNLGRLTYNQKEVKDAQTLFNGEIFLNDAANEDRFMVEAEKAGILHLSMHAFYDENNVDHSGLVFSGYRPYSIIEKEDGFVPMKNIANMQLSASLVILSACETGYGQLEKGEGIASIGRAFKYAGAPSITMSMWYANDWSTYEIIGDFNENIKNGMTKDRAMQEAKLAYLQNADVNTAHPFYWSSFIVNGSMESMEFPSNFNYYWLLLAIAVGLVVLILFIKLKS